MNYFIFGQLITILKNISNKLDMWQDKIQFLIFEIEIVKQYRKIIYSCKNHFSTSFVIVLSIRATISNQCFTCAHPLPSPFGTYNFLAFHRLHFPPSSSWNVSKEEESQELNH